MVIKTLLSGFRPASSKSSPNDEEKSFLLPQGDTHTPPHRCQPSRIRRDSPAFSSDVPGPAKSADVPHFSKMVLLCFSLPIILHVCLTTQQSDELRIKIGSKFARRQATDTLYYRSVRQMPSVLHARQSSPTTVYFFNAAMPASSVNTATVVFTATLEYNTTHSAAAK